MPNRGPVSVWACAWQALKKAVSSLKRTPREKFEGSYRSERRLRQGDLLAIKAAGQSRTGSWTPSRRGLWRLSPGRLIGIFPAPSFSETRLKESPIKRRDPLSGAIGSRFRNGRRISSACRQAWVCGFARNPCLMAHQANAAAARRAIFVPAWPECLEYLEDLVARAGLLAALRHWDLESGAAHNGRAFGMKLFYSVSRDWQQEMETA